MGLSNSLRSIVRKGDLRLAKSAYKHLVVPVYRWADIPVYDITASWKSGYTWFRIPKNGTHSVMEVLTQQDQPEINSSFVPYFRNRHVAQFRFCVIRNPWDRLVSVYCNKVLMKLLYPECWDKDFAYFIDFVSRQDLNRCDGHIRLQTAMFPANDIDYIARMENFESDMEHIQQVIFKRQLSVPRLGSIDRDDYHQYYNAAQRSVVETLYRDDVEFGGYVF